MSPVMGSLDNLYNSCPLRNIYRIRHSRQRDKMKSPDCVDQRHRCHQFAHQLSSLPKCFISSSSSSHLIYISVLICVFLALQATSDVAARRSVAPNFSISPPKINRARIQYKTTYACEHRELHLNCEPNESIHLVRANYGRFSLSICNEGGRLDLSVMCMSYRSFLIMTDRCSNKSNCSVVVSSKLFGDPCPGTAKYLEVQYHCVRGGASLASSSSPSQSTRRPPVQMNIALLGNNSAVNYPIEPVVPTTNSPFNVQDGRKHSEEATSISNNVVVTTASSISKSNWSDTDSKEHSALPDKVQPNSHHYPTNVPLLSSSTTPAPSPTTKISHIDNHLNRLDSVNQPLPDFISLQTKPYPATNNLENSFFSASVENFCPTVFVRSLFWNWTRKGEISTQKCPGGATGFVKWRCNFNPELDIAEWYPARPDFSECRSLWLDNLEERLNNDEPVIRIASELAMMTLTKALYSEDLQRISHLIQRSLTHAVTSIQTALQTVEVWHRHQVLKELLVFIVETISNLLGNAQDDAWLDLSIASRKEVASALIKSLENSALLLAENTNHDGSSAIAKPNVLVSVHVLDTTMPISLQFPTYEDTSGTNEWARMEDSIFLPAQSLVDHSQGDLAKVAFFAYYRIEDLLKPTQQTDIERLNSILTSQLHNLSQSSTLSINSRVIGAAISQNGDIQNYHLSQPVTIVLRHIQEENISSPQCVYWNMEHQNWMTDGCWVESSNSSHTICMCNHLTHFALLSEIKSSVDLGSELKLERMIVLASCFLALVVLAFVTVLIFMTPTGNTVATSIHRNLCLTLFMVEFVYMIVTYFFDSPTIVSFSITLFHYSLLSTFFWTFFESFDIYMNVNSIFENFKSSKRLCWYYIFAYLSPMFIVLVCFAIDPSSYRNLANLLFLNDNCVYLTFIGPIMGLTLGCLVFVLFAYILIRNNANTTTTIKCFEEIRIGCSKSLIRWILFLVLFQCLNWSLALCYLNRQASMPIAAIFTTSNVLLALFICLFCILKIENIQHSRLFRHLPFPFCHEESQISSTKNSTTSDVYSTRPVVTQITSTQVNGINIHTPVPHSPSTPSVASPVSVTSCLPQSHQLPISQSIHWNFQQEALKNSTIQDHQSILAHQDPNYLLCNLSQANGIQTLPREFNSFYGQEPTLDSNIRSIKEALHKKRNKQAESNFEFASLHRSANVPRKSMNRSNENKYTIQAHCNIPNYAPNLDHIYESIDSESMGSSLYDHNRRMNMLNFYGANFRSKSTVNEDELSSSSIYEDKPLLFSNNSSMFHDMNNRPKCTFTPTHYQSNASIYDKAAKEKAIIDHQQLVHGQSNALWQYGKDSNELPDLIQKANHSNNLIVSYSGENKFLNKVINSNQTSKSKC